MLSQRNEPWKTRFGEALQLQLEKETGCPVPVQRVVPILDTRNTKEMNVFWTTIAHYFSVQCRTTISNQQVRDYYFNTWYTKFFDSYTLFSGELRALVHSNVHVDTRSLANMFQEAHPDKRFCGRQVQQQIYHLKQNFNRKHGVQQFVQEINSLFELAAQK